jgi:hypothetical protein
MAGVLLETTFTRKIGTDPLGIDWGGGGACICVGLGSWPKAALSTDKNIAVPAARCISFRISKIQQSNACAESRISTVIHVLFRTREEPNEKTHS